MTKVPTDSSTAESLGNMSNTYATPQLEEYSCKPFQSDTDIIKGVKIFCYCVVLLVSVFGNSLLIAIIKKNKRLQTITNYLIVNMAVSDIVITMLAIPRQITEILFEPRRWIMNNLLGSFLCKSVSFFQDMSIAVSTLSLVAIAIDRYRAVVFPLRKEVAKSAKVCKIIIPLIWLISIGLHSVYFYIFQTATYSDKTYCIVSWALDSKKRKHLETYYIILLVCEIAIPSGLVTILYSAIILNLKRNGTARRKGSSSFVTSRRLREDRKVVRIITTILTTFIVCSIPISVFGILFYFVWDWSMPCGMENVIFAAHFILYSNAAANPCIYFILNDKYRQGLLDVLRDLHIIRNREIVRDEGIELVAVEQEV